MNFVARAGCSNTFAWLIATTSSTGPTHPHPSSPILTQPLSTSFGPTNGLSPFLISSFSTPVIELFLLVASAAEKGSAIVSLFDPHDNPSNRGDSCAVALKWKTDLLHINPIPPSLSRSLLSLTHTHTHTRTRTHTHSHFCYLIPSLEHLSCRPLSITSTFPSSTADLIVSYRGGAG
jgi:hypothetical protein